MFTLANADLTLDVLDPVADAHRLGPRFIGGGFIWQVHDARVGPLLTGPEWPHPDPSPFNAQGLPESFRHQTRTGAPLLWRDGLGLAPGAGTLRRDAAGDVALADPCRWTIDPRPDRLTFCTGQQTPLGNYRLTREIILRGRTVASVTHLTNTGDADFPLQWFAHPFFALGADGLATVALPPGTRLSDETGFFLKQGTLRFHRRFHGEDDGAFALLTLPDHQSLAATFSHPDLMAITFHTDFAPSECPVWANGNTISVEPYQDLRLAPGETRHWTLHYDFLAAER